VKRGDVLLVPLTDLPLTAEGKGLVGSAQGQQASEGRGEIRANQLKVARELAALVSDVRGGRYVDAVRRGNTFLAQGELTRPQLSTVHRQLLEAYVALGAIGLAAESCDAWQKAAPGSPLDPTWLSPKILNACRPAP